MNRWIHKINLNQVLADASEKHDLSRLELPCPAEVLDAIAMEIAKAPPLSRFAPRIKESKSIAEVNRVLANAFNEADRFGVWCGFAM